MLLFFFHNSLLSSRYWIYAFPTEKFRFKQMCRSFNFKVMNKIYKTLELGKKCFQVKWEKKFLITLSLWQKINCLFVNLGYTCNNSFAWWEILHSFTISWACMRLNYSKKYYSDYTISHKSIYKVSYTCFRDVLIKYLLNLKDRNCHTWRNNKIIL